MTDDKQSAQRLMKIEWDRLNGATIIIRIPDEVAVDEVSSTLLCCGFDEIDYEDDADIEAAIEEHGIDPDFVYRVREHLPDLRVPLGQVDG